MNRIQAAKINTKNFIKDIIYAILEVVTVIFFHMIRAQYKCKSINYPKEKCIFALWHAHQCGVYTCQVDSKERDTIIMVSNSRDGNVISRAANAMGVQTVRGSLGRKGSKQATFEMIKKIKEENMNGALTIDGPKGPKRVVKKGIVEIARMSGVPIVPAVWWSPQKRFLKFKSWDEFRFPLFGTRLVMLFGEPIDVPHELSDEEVENIRKNVEDSLNSLYKDIKQNYYKYLSQKN